MGETYSTYRTRVVHECDIHQMSLFRSCQTFCCLSYSIIQRVAVVHVDAVVQKQVCQSNGDERIPIVQVLYLPTYSYPSGSKANETATTRTPCMDSSLRRLGRNGGGDLQNILCITCEDRSSETTTTTTRTNHESRFSKKYFQRVATNLHVLHIIFPMRSKPTEWLIFPVSMQQ